MPQRRRLQTPKWRHTLRVYGRTATRLGSEPAVVLRLYAVVAFAGGCFLFFALVNRNAADVALTVFGVDRGATPLFATLLIALGVLANAFAASDPQSVTRGLHALAAVHMILWMVIAARPAPLTPVPPVVWPLLAIAALFAYIGQAPNLPERPVYAPLLTLFGRAPTGLPPAFETSPRGMLARLRPHAPRTRQLDELRSTYERQIREAARQEERHRLARDLHDAVKQQLFVIQTAAATAQTRFESDEAGARGALEQVRQAARAAMTELEAMLDQLQTSPLEATGLVEALKKQCEALGFRTGATVTFEMGALPPDHVFAPGAPQALFRVAQEALANVGRHARARHVWVHFDWMGDSIRLVVKDDGSGFEPGARPSGMGMENMSAGSRVRRHVRGLQHARVWNDRRRDVSR